MAESPEPSHPGAPIQDRRRTPRGVLPRQLQTWLMVGLAVVIVLIILITGHSTAPAPPAATTRPAPPTLPDSSRIRAYQQQLTDEETRLQHVQSQAAATVGSTTAASDDPTVEDQRQRAYQSLFASNVAFSQRTSGRAAAEAPPAVAAPPPTAPPSPVLPPTAARTSTENPAPGPRLRLLEGTVIETALLNRLDGTFAGPVECLVTTPVYSQDRQSVLIPAGARVLGTAAPVQAWGDSRLAVSFHRLVMPDGHTYSLDGFKGLDQIGEAGLKDEVNHHYLQVFGASLAIGALSGLAQYSTRGFDANTFGDAYRQSSGASLATSSSRVLDRYLNVLPTVTIREGFRIKVYLTNDLFLPAYADTGGVQ